MPARANTDTSNQYSPNDLQPAAYTSGYIEAGGLRLRYLDYGTAGRPAMLCLHGGGAHGHWFDFIAANFSTDYHVRALDQRGHGDSEWAVPPDYSYERFAADLAEVVEKLDLRDFVLIGHSMGGMVALVYAATYPGRLGKLIIVDSSQKINAERVAAMRGFGARPGTSYATREELVARYRLQPGGTTAAPAILRHLAEHGCKQMSDGNWKHKFDRNVYAARKTVESMVCWDRIKIPALLVKGELSDRITQEVYAEVRTHCPQLELAEVLNSYHHVTLDNPSGFTQAVKAFLAKHS